MRGEIGISIILSLNNKEMDIQLKKSSLKDTFGGKATLKFFSLSVRLSFRNILRNCDFFLLLLSTINIKFQ